MSGYDPQRSRSRPRPADAGPAPVDAILGDSAGDQRAPSDVATIEPVESEARSSTESAAPANGSAARTGPVVEDIGQVAADTGGPGAGRPVILLSLVAGAVLAVVLFLRRRRRNRPAD